eukprot:7001538-Alexandrium_andersonii.AAC.1
MAPKHNGPHVDHPLARCSMKPLHIRAHYPDTGFLRAPVPTHVKRTQISPLKTRDGLTHLAKRNAHVFQLAFAQARNKPRAAAQN